MVTRDARQRIGHALLGCVVLCLLALGSYVLLVGTYDPKRADWTCNDVVTPAGVTCLDIDMWSD